ncbi:copia protein [Tanacetum coccineum]
MQEELNQFIANDVWELVPQPKNMTVIGTKWVFRNKLDENGIVSRNKARLVAQGYNQQEGIDYDETYAPVARLESIRILLAYACALDFKLFQMDVKSAFLNGFINEEFEMSMMGELNFFLGLQIKQMEDGIFFNQSKYIKEMLKKFGLEDSKPMKTPMSSDTKLTKDEELSAFVPASKRLPKPLTLKLLSVVSTIHLKNTRSGGLVKWKRKVSILFREKKREKRRGLIDFECHIDINEQICPHFILEFYSQFCLSYNDDGEIFVEFMFQDQYYSFSLEEFAEILGAPCEGVCVFTDKWALYELPNGLPGDGPYQTFLPSLDDIITLVCVDREGPVTRVRHKKEIDVIEYQVLTREIDPTFKDIETIL